MAQSRCKVFGGWGVTGIAEQLRHCTVMPKGKIWAAPRVRAEGGPQQPADICTGEAGEVAKLSGPPGPCEFPVFQVQWTTFCKDPSSYSFVYIYRKNNYPSPPPPQIFKKIGHTKCPCRSPGLRCSFTLEWAIRTALLAVGLHLTKLVSLCLNLSLSW